MRDIRHSSDTNLDSGHWISGGHAGYTGHDVREEGGDDWSRVQDVLAPSVRDQLGLPQQDSDIADHGDRDGEGGLPGEGLGQAGGAVGDGRLLGRGGEVEDLRHLAPRHVRPVEAERGEDGGCDDVMKARAPPWTGPPLLRGGLL